MGAAPGHSTRALVAAVSGAPLFESAFFAVATSEAIFASLPLLGASCLVGALVGARWQPARAMAHVDATPTSIRQEARGLQRKLQSPGH